MLFNFSNKIEIRLRPFNESGEGFTLIETAIYIALFAIIIGGGMVAAYQVIEGSDKLKIQTVIEQEANFILRKIDWAMTNASGDFTIDGAGAELTIPHSNGTIIFKIDSGNLIIVKDGTPTPLNISSITISNPSTGQLFQKTDDRLDVSFKVSSLDAKNSQEFTMTKYAKF